MNDPSRILERLAAAARMESALTPDQLPSGLVTRVLTRMRERTGPSLWESSALVALSVAAVVTLVCVLLGSPAAEPPDEAEMISGLMLESELPISPEP
ncbi:MAG: hypothetical protein J0M04_05340 [Verrucomicrobia bacterium]|nr:hypothetical protein [Verrucomicrobiota bacterium]